MKANIEEIIAKLETEQEFWEAIEEMGGFLWRMNHDLADGRIEESGGISQDLVNIAEVQKSVVAEMCKRFNVVPREEEPKRDIGEELPAPPKGKVWYWQWYGRVKKKVLGAEYDTFICSKCPYSRGRKSYIASGGGLSHCDGACISGSSQGLEYTCAVIRHHDDRETESFYKKMESDHGVKVVDQHRKEIIQRKEQFLLKKEQAAQGA